MPRAINKRAVLKKQCKVLEGHIRLLVSKAGYKYHKSTLEPLADEVQVAIDNVKSFNIEYGAECDGSCGGVGQCYGGYGECVGEIFCQTHRLPPFDKPEKYSDIQALFFSLLVTGFFQDIDDISMKNPDAPMLLFPALAFYKIQQVNSALNKEGARKAEKTFSVEERASIDKKLFDYVEKLLIELKLIAHVVSSENTLVINPDPFEYHADDLVAKRANVSEKRSESVKKSADYKNSQVFRKDMLSYAKSVRSLMAKFGMLDTKSKDEINAGVWKYCQKGISFLPKEDKDPFQKSLSEKGFTLLEKYNNDFDISTFNRHLNAVIETLD
jgi:hypothetical protein